MEIHITHRIEGDRKPASGLVGAMGGTSPADTEETTVEISDFPVDDVIRVAFTAADTLLRIIEPAIDKPETLQTWSGENA